MKQFLLCLALAVAVPSVSHTQSVQAPDRVRTFGFFNGYTWNSFPSVDIQRFYIAGMSEAMIREAPTAFQKDYMTGNLTTADVGVLISNFYSQPANLFIPVIDALHIISMKTHGASQAEIDEMIQVQRDVATKAPERGGSR